MLILGVDIVAVPVNDIVLVDLSELVEGMNLILYYFLAGAGGQVVSPSVREVPALHLGPLKEAMVHLEGPAVYVVRREGAERHKDEDCVYAAYEDGAFAKLDVPEWLRWIVWEAEALLDAECLQASTAPVDGVLSNEINYWAYNQRKVAEDEHDNECAQREERVHLMHDEGCHFNAAVSAGCLHWSNNQKKRKRLRV